MAHDKSNVGEGPQQQEGRDRQPTESPEKVRESSRRAKKDHETPKEQPDRNEPEPNKDFSHNQK